MPKTDDVLKRFYDKVHIDHETGCWEWKASKYPNGYGQFFLSGRITGAHRASYRLHTGPIPDGMLVCHACDNRGCVNPGHLSVGTQKDNMAGAVERERVARGKALPQTKLEPAEVLAIRADDRNIYTVADTYKISIAQVSRIRNKRDQRHV